MAYPVTISQIEFALTRLCNKIVVYNKTSDTIFTSHNLRVNSGGTMISKYFFVSVNGTDLTISNQPSAPGTGWNSQVFTTNFTDPTLPHLHDAWTNDNGTGKIVVGTGDTRDVVDTVWLFDLGAGIVLSSSADNKLTIYYQDGTLVKNDW